MSLKVQEFAELMADALTCGDIEDVMAVLGESLTVYIEGEILQLTSRDILRAFVASIIARNRVEGVHGIAVRVISQSLPLGGRFRFTANWVYDLGPDRMSLVALLAFYCCERQGTARIDMLEVLEPAFPNSAAWHMRDTGHIVETLPDLGWGPRRVGCKSE